jgi:hypothetical protein
VRWLADKRLAEDVPNTAREYRNRHADDTIDDLNAHARTPAMDDIPWYSEAVLTSGGHLHRAGTLIQCVRKWALLSEAQRNAAQLKLSCDLEGRRSLDGDQITRLTTLPSFLKA